MGPRRARLWLSAAAVAGYLPVIGVPLRRWLDFAAFYAGGQLAFQSSLLDPVAVVRLQAAQGLPPTPFVSPPFVALVYAPFSGLPYDVAAVIQIAVMAGALVGGAVLWADALGLSRRWAILGALAWGPASASVVSGQLDTMALLLSGAAVRLLAGTGPASAPIAGQLAGGSRGRARRAALAGLATAALAFKPQVTFGAVFGTLRHLGWRGAGALLFGGLVLYLLAAAAAGWDPVWPVRWVAALQSYSSADFAANGWQASSPVSLGIRAAFMSDGVAAVSSLVAGAAASVAVVWWSLRRWSPRSVAMDVAMWSAVGLVLSPHLWAYDATLLLPAIGALAAVAGRAGWPAADRATLTLVFAAGALWPLGGVIGISPVLIAVLVVPLRTGLLGHVADREQPAIVTPNSPC